MTSRVCEGVGCDFDLTGFHQSRKRCHPCSEERTRARNREYARLARDGDPDDARKTSRAYYARKRYLVTEGVKRWQVKNRDRFDRLTRRHKRMCGCAKCGYKENHLALQYDHIHPSLKSCAVGKMRHSSIKKVKEEIRKCRVLCANCHMIHTDFQRRTGVIPRSPHAKREK